MVIVILKEFKGLEINHFFKLGHSIFELTGLFGQFWQIESARRMQLVKVKPKFGTITKNLNLVWYAFENVH